jgi:hypothetical protein
MVKLHEMGWMGVLLMLLVTMGCTRPYNAYPGPPRPESELAVITPQAGVKIHALDGRAINVTPGPAQGLDVKYKRFPGHFGVNPNCEARSHRQSLPYFIGDADQSGTS